MEWDVAFDATRGAAVVTTRGVFDDADHARMVADVVGRPQWRPGHRVLFDHRALDFGGAGYQQMLAARDNHVANDARIGNARSAILMKSLADFGRGRQFELLVDGVVRADLAVFVDEGAAWEWLTAERAD
ncbi:hypothetical protein [Roseisolibacter sp. H3M3-2]|uniref:hypothetical protein n=1 Tax=Roseisolibacter sp. H3M3-2 TaxID=3031323 RepID=UPI0023DA57DF|nr:hypothetical protein [Roseisolibacter sp. H3M3-2]MDF1503075.1 hypothetical protein [Roseisolibacter sp. H3M3-2]